MAKAHVVVNDSQDKQDISVPANSIAVIMKIEERPSKSGKMNLITCSNGNQETETEFRGRPVIVNANICYYPTPKQ